MIFNGHDLSEYLTVNSVYGRGLASTDVSTIEVPGMDGVHYAGSNRSYRVLDVEYTIKASDPFELRAIIDELNAILDVSEPVPIVFEDEPERTYYGVPEQNSEDREFVRFHKGEISFICPDPYKYGPEKTALFPSSNVILHNEGSADTPPIFEMEVLEPITFAMIQKGEEENAEYQMIGSPADVDTEIVDERIPVLDERGSTLDDWYVPPGNWSGEFATTGDAISVSDWGSGTQWHGPALMKEIDPLDDYEIEMYVYVRAEQPSQTFRISTNFYDEYMNELGMLRLWDRSSKLTRKVVEARIGPYVGDFINYPISSRNYELRDQRVWGGIIRVRKVGDRFTYYASRITQAGRHVTPLEVSYVDRENQYAGRLKFIRFDMANYGNTPTPNEARIEYIKVTKLSEVTEDKTPYIAYPGDLIIFDHTTGELLINGEDRTDLKDFGGTYFKLSKGTNQLITFPDGSLATRVRFRERFK